MSWLSYKQRFWLIKTSSRRASWLSLFPLVYPTICLWLQTSKRWIWSHPVCVWCPLSRTSSNRRLLQRRHTRRQTWPWANNSRQPTATRHLLTWSTKPVKQLAWSSCRSMTLKSWSKIRKTRTINCLISRWTKIFTRTILFRHHSQH